MTTVFSIFGYGIPKNIFKDENYNFYLKMVFNKIYDIVVKNNISKPLIIFSGGKTDCFKPHQRIEGEEMEKFFNNMIKSRIFLSKITKNWICVPEKESLSTLENLLNTRKILTKRKIIGANVIIFCEQTRAARIKTLSKSIFGAKQKTTIKPIDFDVSKNRYVAAEYVLQKEKIEVELSKWALQSEGNLKKYHQAFADRIVYMRKMGKNLNGEVLWKWWMERLESMKTNKNFR